MMLRLSILASSLFVMTTAGFADPGRAAPSELTPRDYYRASIDAGAEAPTPSLVPDARVALASLATPEMAPEFTAYSKRMRLPNVQRRSGVFDSMATEGFFKAIGLSSTVTLLFGLIPVVLFVLGFWSVRMASAPAPVAPSAPPPPPARVPRPAA